MLSIVNVPTAVPSLESARLDENGVSDSEVRGYSDDGKLKGMKYISLDFIKNITILVKKYYFRLMKYFIERNSNNFNRLPQRVF